MTLPTNFSYDKRPIREGHTSSTGHDNPYEPYQSEARKEQIKANGNFLNLVAGGFITAGIIGPAVAVLLGLTSSSASPVLYVMVFGGSALSGIALRVGSHWIFSSLRDNPRGIRVEQ